MPYFIVYGDADVLTLDLTPPNRQPTPPDLPDSSGRVGRRVKVEWYKYLNSQETHWYKGWIIGLPDDKGRHTVVYDKSGPTTRRYVHKLEDICYAYLPKHLGYCETDGKSPKIKESVKAEICRVLEAKENHACLFDGRGCPG